MSVLGLPYREVWLIDFEYIAPDGENPRPVCMVAQEMASGCLLRLWADELEPGRPPFEISDETLFISFQASAEWSCFLALDWPIPEHVLDLYVEGLAETNGQMATGGSGLLAVMARHGILGITKAEKQDWRERIMVGFPFTDDEREGILDYCESDVTPMGALLERMLPGILTRKMGFPRAVLRARYMAAVAKMERNGVPVDLDTLEVLRSKWDDIKTALVAAVDCDFDVYDGTSFRAWKFAEYLKRERIMWPRDFDTNALKLDGDTFRDMSKVYPQIAPLKELRSALGELRLESLTVGSDGRNRTSLMPFRARTGRNQPSNSKFVFGPSAWIRFLITPPKGRALAYLDWSAQEVAIAAYLSGDEAMIEAVESGDPYLSFAMQSGLVPHGSVKHKDCACDTCTVRSACKTVVLGSNYGMTAPTLAYRIGRHQVEAVELLTRLKEVWSKYFAWRENMVEHALLYGGCESVYGWPMHVDSLTRPNAIRNYQMQANGAEMLRLAACYTTEAGIDVAAPVHDALLIEADDDQIDAAIATTKRCMSEAASDVMFGHTIAGIDATIVRHGERYTDGRGEVMWQRVTELAGVQLESASSAASATAGELPCSRGGAA